MNNHHLTQDAQADRDNFDCEMQDHGCTCFISPPCSYCMHPGNPFNQEDEACWEPDVIEKAVVKSRNKREGWYAGKSRAKLMRLWGESKKPRRFRVPEQRLNLRLWYRDAS